MNGLVDIMVMMKDVLEDYQILVHDHVELYDMERLYLVMLQIQRIVQILVKKNHFYVEMDNSDVLYIIFDDEVVVLVRDTLAILIIHILVVP
jgi:hypothetical protein